MYMVISETFRYFTHTKKKIHTSVADMVTDLE